MSNSRGLRYFRSSRLRVEVVCAPLRGLMISMAGGKATRAARETGSVRERNGQVPFPDPDPAEENGIGVLFDKGETEEILDLGAVDFLGPVPVERLEGF